MACYSNWRYHNVPGVKEKHAARMAVYYEKNKKEMRLVQMRYFKKRYHSDPAFRQRVLDNNRRYRERKKSAAKLSAESPGD